MEVSLINISGDVHQFYQGCPSFLERIQDDLMCSIFKWCERGLQVITRLLPFCSENAKEIALSKQGLVQMFCEKIELMHSIAPHVAQKSHHDTEEEAMNFVVVMREKVSCINPDHITKWIRC